MYARLSRGFGVVNMPITAYRNYSKCVTSLYARNGSAYTGSLYTINADRQNQRLYLKTTDHVLNSFILQQRYFSVSTLRLNTELSSTIAAAAAANLPTNEAADKSGEAEVLTEAATPEFKDDAASLNCSVPDAAEAPVASEVVSEAAQSIDGAANIVADAPEVLTAAEVPEVLTAAEVPEVLTAADSTKELILDFLPEKPVPLDPTVVLGEPAFESLGLGSWWPPGRLQILMEYLHVDIGLEWYQVIALTALCMRLITFPFTVMAQKNMANMNNNMPGMAALQDKMTDARKRGDLLESAQIGNQLQEYMKKAGINPIKNILPMAVQAPIFMSMFIGLRGMANLPVPSMEQGGVLWFENLSMADPFYLLPFLTSSSLYLQFRLGADGARLSTMGPTGRILMTVMPFLLMPITLNFPSAITYYWFCTNVISLTQASILRIPQLRTYLGIPKLIVWDKTAAETQKKKGFRASVRESIDNFRVQADIADRRALDEQAFKDAGAAKPIRTYPYDPSKPVAIKHKKY